MNSSSETILVIGGGVTGLSAALDLARLGVSVVVTEKSDVLGGHAAQLSCKAADTCVACGACVVQDKIQQAVSHPGISIHTHSHIETVNRSDRFEICLKEGQKSVDIKADAILLASGFSPFNPVNKPYGYGIFENVLTTLDVDRMLRQNSVIHRPSDAGIPQSVAFIQCVGSRDSSLRHLWCSKICCGESLRMARLIQHRQPGTYVTFFYIDVQTFGKNFRTYYADIQQHIRMIRSIPADLLKTHDDRLQLSYFDPDTQASLESVFDMVILSIGLMPSEDALNLTGILHIDPDYFTYGSRENISLPDGIFAAGAAVEPMNIEESIVSAGKAVVDILGYLEKTPVCREGRFKAGKASI